MHTPSALALNLTRAYAPNLGRWINRDSLGEAGGINLYAYTKNSPVSHRDPTGKSCDCNGEPCGWGDGYLWGNDHYGYPLQPPDDGDEPPDDGDEDPPNIIGAGPLNCRDKCFNARMRCLARCKTLPPEKREDCFSNCRAKYFRCIAACKDKGQ